MLFLEATSSLQGDVAEFKRQIESLQKDLAEEKKTSSSLNSKLESSEKAGAETLKLQKEVILQNSFPYFFVTFVKVII